MSEKRLIRQQTINQNLRITETKNELTRNRQIPEIMINQKPIATKERDQNQKENMVVGQGKKFWWVCLSTIL